MLAGSRIGRVTEKSGRAELTIDGCSTHYDHVLLATGYKIDIAKLDLFAPSLLNAIACRDGAPCYLPGLRQACRDSISSARMRLQVSAHCCVSLLAPSLPRAKWRTQLRLAASCSRHRKSLVCSPTSDETDAISHAKSSMYVMTGQQMPKQSETASPNGSIPGAVILGGAHGSLAVARSLGRHGIPVWFVTHDHPIARYSRYTKKSLAWDGPDHENAVDWLTDLGRRNGIEGWLLFAGADPEVRLVARHYEELAKTYRLTGPTWPAAQVTCDKRATYEHATAVGVATPLELYPHSRDEAAAIVCELPATLKPNIHRGRNAFTTAKAWRVTIAPPCLRATMPPRRWLGAKASSYKSLFPAAARRSFPMLPFGSTVRRLPRWWRGAHDNFPWIFDLPRHSLRRSRHPRWRMPRAGSSHRYTTTASSARIQARCPRWAIQAARCQPATLDFDRLGRGRRPRPPPHSMAARPRRAGGDRLCTGRRRLVPCFTGLHLGLSADCKRRGDVSAIRSIIAPSDGVRRLRD